MILKKIEHPETAKTLFELGVIKDITIKNRKVSLTLNLPLKRALKEEAPDIIIEINLKEMGPEEKLKFIKMAREGWGGQE